MRLQIWKFPLRVSEEPFSIKMPKGAKILCAKNVGGTLCLYAVCDVEAEFEERSFRCIGTVWETSNVLEKYIGTIVDLPFVWHFFEV